MSQDQEVQSNDSLNSFLSKELQDSLTRFDNSATNDSLDASSLQDIIKTQDAVHEALGSLDSRADSLLEKMRKLIESDGSYVASHDVQQTVVTKSIPNEQVSLSNIIKEQRLKAEEQAQKDALERVEKMSFKETEEHEAFSMYKKRGGLLGSGTANLKNDSSKVDDQVASGLLKW